MIPDDQQQKINRWNFARGLGDLTLDDLLSDSESEAAPTGQPIVDGGNAPGPNATNVSRPDGASHERSAT